MHELLEGREGHLYHFMDCTKAACVFEDDLMVAGWSHVIPGQGTHSGNSFTRDTYLNWTRPVKISVSQRILSQTNRIIPLDGDYIWARQRFGGDPAAGRSKYGRDLKEEFVVGDIKQIHRCIVRIEYKGFEFSPKYFKLYEIVCKYTNKWHITLDINEEDLTRIEDWRRSNS